MALYDGRGNAVGSSGFGVADYAVYGDDRQGKLTYQGKTFFPQNYPAQRMEDVKIYSGGIMLTLGDSYTAYMSSFFDAFAAKHGLVQDNRGVASSTIAGTTDGSVGFKPFWSRLDAAISEYTAGKSVGDKSYTAEDVKLITFMGGANDWTTVDASSGINRLGSGRDETDKATLYGALNYIFPKLLEAFPQADVIVILQPSNPDKGVQNMYLKESIVREMAEMYSLPIADCCFDWHQHHNAADKAKYWQTDELHLTSAGHDDVIKVLESTVNNLRFYRASRQ